MNLNEINNDAKGIVEFPLTPKEMGILRDIYSKFVVELKAEDVSKQEALSVVIKINPKVSPVWVLQKFICIDEFKVIKDSDMIRFIFDKEKTEVKTSVIEKKGGEKVKRNYNTRNTSGENKVAKAILEECDFEAVPSVSKEAFERYLEVILPSINKRVKPNLALKVMLRGMFLVEKEGNISLGEKGKELLSQ